jgi:hypothetical protein
VSRDRGLEGHGAVVCDVRCEGIAGVLWMRCEGGGRGRGGFGEVCEGGRVSRLQVAGRALCFLQLPAQTTEGHSAAAAQANQPLACVLSQNSELVLTSRPHPRPHSSPPLCPAQCACPSLALCVLPRPHRSPPAAIAALPLRYAANVSLLAAEHSCTELNRCRRTAWPSRTLSAPHV